MKRLTDDMDNLTLFGLFAVTSMLVTYALEPRSSWFAGSCALGSTSCKAHGRLVLSRESGHSSPFAGGNVQLHGEDAGTLDARAGIRNSTQIPRGLGNVGNLRDQAALPSPPGPALLPRF